jgi:hypothetical protein
MRRLALVLIAGSLLAWNAAAQSGSGAQPSAQPGASASSSTSAQAGSTGVQATHNSSGSTAAQAGNNSASLASGTTMNAALSRPVDAKKNKPGDPVMARTTQATQSDGQVVIPKGTQLVGHVSQAQARSKSQSESALGIVFDKAILKNGQQVPLNVTIQALATASTMASSSAGADDLGLSGGAAGGSMASGRRSGGASALGGVSSTAGGAVGSVASPAANVGSAANGAVVSTANAAGAARGTGGGLNAAGQLTSNSQGVFGLNGLNLASVAAGSAQGSLITSTSQNVHLDSGTQIVLSATSQAQAQASKQ